MTSPYATNEDPAALWYEQSAYISTHLATMGYGALPIVTIYDIALC